MKKLLWNLVRVSLVMLIAISTLIGPMVAYAAQESNTEVKDLQERLIELGYLEKGQDDGVFGPKTDFAVRWLQWSCGLDVDGIVGEKTASVLGMWYTEPLYYEAYYGAKNGYAIGVNTEKCTFKVWQLTNNGCFDYWSLIRDERCCVGKNGTTPLGSYTLGGKTDGFWNSGYYYAYFSSFSGDYGFHSVPISKDGKTHDSCLGQAKSHGCVRLKLETAEWLQDTLPKGTKVYIY